ncbi:MAG: tRNA uridine(34) 5-carboxymethylaminomethyl modification radical SAM/GNAT enzyme Elp3 [Candidatus Gracilibacteria bacterium]|nr:tRNA uridine(34) 5-carboxymethylaminomethyl modification radical SAM/GNAT enzyme Elp3 [Candidatus Gracilibacteria bacterium]
MSSSNYQISEQERLAAEEFLKRLSKKNSRKEFFYLNRQIAEEFQISCLSQSSILNVYKSLIKKGKLKPEQWLLDVLRKNKIRTLSGVAPIAVLTKNYPCPGKCVYCPTESKVPKSYNSNEPAVMRAIMNDYDAEKQVRARIKALEATGHDTSKCEIIVMGGTFSALPRDYQEEFIKGVFRGLNGGDAAAIGAQNFAPLQAMQKQNETATHRCVGLTLETRPDKIDLDEIKQMRKLGCTRVEIGVQSVFDDVLRKVKRGHLSKETIKATYLMKEAGLKVCYHMMPNLPGSNLTKDLEMFQELFSNPDFQPDQIKIYPCLVTRDAELKKWYEQGKYKPYSDQELVKLLAKIKKIIPTYVRIIRLGRDIPAQNIIAGSKFSNLRQLAQNELKKQGAVCHCIRCREVRDAKDIQAKLELRNEKYVASGGMEHFLSFEDPGQGKLYAHLRLRIPKSFLMKKKAILPVLQDAAIVRELHTYGEALPIELRKEKASQHQGLGKKLLKEAEKLAQKTGCKKMAIISGIGVRPYYRKLGYKLQDGYMVKKI